MKKEIKILWEECFKMVRVYSYWHGKHPKNFISIEEALSDGTPYNRKNAAWVSAVDEAPVDSFIYGRKDGDWEIVGSGIFVEAPVDGETYGRENGEWVTISGGGHVILDEGNVLTQRNNLNFVGSGVTVSDMYGGIGSLPVYDATASSHLSGAATYLEWSHILGSGSNRIVLVGIAMRAVTASSVTFNSVAMTFIRRDKPGGDVCSELWYMLEDELPAAGTYTIRVNGSTSQQWVAGSVSFSNCTGLVPSSSTGANGTDTLSEVDMLTPLTDYQIMVDIIALQEGSNSVTIDDGATQLWEEASAVNTGGMGWKKNSDGGTYDGSTWIFGNSSAWASTIVSIQGSASGDYATTITISGGIQEAPIDGEQYARQNGEWTTISGATGSFTSQDSKTITVVGGIITSIV